MKWIKQDIYGNEQIWYSGDVIEKIKEECLNNALLYHQYGVTPVGMVNPVIQRIYQIIESEDKNAL